jgi:hypothetical protein
LILDRSRLALERSCGVGLVTATKWLGKDEHGLATAILTERNSVAISIAPESQEISERLLKTLRKSADLHAECEGSIPFTHSLASLSRQANLSRHISVNPGKSKMAEADLDGVIRSIAKKQHKLLMDAAKKQHGRWIGMATKAKDKAAKARYKQTAKNTLLLAGAAARRLQITAENAADSYARAMKKAAEEMKKAAEEKPAKPVKSPKPAKKAAKKKTG